MIICSSLVGVMDRQNFILFYLILIAFGSVYLGLCDEDINIFKNKLGKGDKSILLYCSDSG